MLAVRPNEDAGKRVRFRMIRWFRDLLQAIFRVEKKFLCDSCKYDYGNACHRPERPNAIKCPDYKRAG